MEELRIVADDGARLVGSLGTPLSSGPAPVVVAVHGASGGTRTAQLLTHLAGFLPSLGVAVLTFDRRGEGASGGDVSQCTLGRLEADVAAWLGSVKGNPAVDERLIGLWAHSQGGWIAPAVAAADPSVAFILAVSPCGITPAEQMDHAARSALRAAGQPEAPALALRASVNDCYRGPQIDRAKALALIEAARGEPWFEHALLPDPSDPADDAWAADLDFDVTPALRALNVPALALFGGRDRWIPVDRSIAVWGAALGARLSTTVLGEAGHALTTSFEPDDPEEAGPLDSGYEPALEKWLRDLVGELRQHVRGG